MNLLCFYSSRLFLFHWIIRTSYAFDQMKSKILWFSLTLSIITYFIVTKHTTQNWMLNSFFDARVNSVIAPLPHRAYKVYYTYAKWNRVKFLSWHFGSVYIRFRRVVLLSVVMVSRHNTCTHTHHTESVRTQCTYIGNAYTHTRQREGEWNRVAVFVSCIPFRFSVFFLPFFYPPVQ